MSRFVPATICRSGSLSLSFALGLVMFCEMAQAGPPETPVAGLPSLSRATQGTLIDLNAIFAESDSCAVIPGRRRSSASAVTAVVLSDAPPQ